MTDCGKEKINFIPKAPSWSAAAKTSSISPKELLKDCNRIASAPLIVFPSFDWSVLHIKKCFNLAIPYYLFAGIRFRHVPNRKAYGYVRSIHGEWNFNLTFTEQLQTIVDNVFHLPKDIILDYPGFDVLFFCELPYGYAFHEQSVAALTLAAVLSKSKKRSFIENIAWKLMWYKASSGAMLLCSSRSSRSEKIMFFDRTADEDLDFIEILQGNEKLAEKNLSLDVNKSFRAQWIPFDIGKYSILLGKPALSDVGKMQSTIGCIEAVNKLKFMNTDNEELFKNSLEAFSENDLQALSFVIKSQRTILDECGFSEKEHEKLLDDIEKEEGILSAKTTATHQGGAILILKEKDMNLEKIIAKYDLTLVSGSLRPASGLEIRKW